MRTAEIVDLATVRQVKRFMSPVVNGHAIERRVEVREFVTPDEQALFYEEWNKRMYGRVPVVYPFC